MAGTDSAMARRLARVAPVLFDRDDTEPVSLRCVLAHQVAA